MLIVQVSIQVKSDCIDAFIEATRANASASVNEPGIARFDFTQRTDDPTQFQLLEVYRDHDAPAAHKATEHYQTWRDTVASMMAAPRESAKFHNLFPDDKGW